MILSKVYEDAEHRLERNEITLGEFERLVDIEVIEPKRGEWEVVDTLFNLAKCSNCKKVTMFETWGDKVVSYNFCPNCGAKMGGSNDE